MFPEVLCQFVVRSIVYFNVVLMLFLSVSTYGDRTGGINVFMIKRVCVCLGGDICGIICIPYFELHFFLSENNFVN